MVKFVEIEDETGVLYLNPNMVVSVSPFDVGADGRGTEIVMVTGTRYMTTVDVSEILKKIQRTSL